MAPEALKEALKTVKLPKPLERLLAKTFELQEERDRAEKAFQAQKGKVQAYLEANPNIEAEAKEHGLRSELGLASYQTRSTWSFDAEAILAFAGKEIPKLEGLIRVASWRCEDLMTFMGIDAFNRVAKAAFHTTLSFRRDKAGKKGT